MLTFFWLLVGCIAAVIFVYLARLQGEKEVHALATGLIVAALIYLGFGLFSGSILWMGIECSGILLYGALAFLGIRYNPIWIAIGWGLHPAWDVGLHLSGSGAEFVPFGYAMLCLSLDLVVAGYVAGKAYWAQRSIAQVS